ncbi:ROK family transcriptional regulator [Evansella halocellulosilytica]|uniref:ROK family transcriptional regulator n=1 Tax=Evansella halocellulosilytica TaxID=2011013 RepID=UPI000BB73AC9|nr:ROK family transcriptional regulator [Evansella halocellulosilytica]
MEKHDNLYIKKQNKKWVLDIIKSSGPVSRADISKRTNMSPTSISRIVQELEHDGFVKETDLISSGVGRKANLLDICDDAFYTIGVDLTEKSIKVGILNFNDQLAYIKKVAKPPDEDYKVTLKNMSLLIDKCIDEYGITKEKVAGIAVGMPGYINYESGYVTLSTQLGWHDIPAAKMLADMTGLKVIVDNDLKMKAMAEYMYGAAKNSRSSVLIGIGSGIGSAIIMNGEFYRGENNFAGEIAHTVVDINGSLCKCGKFGCLTTVVTKSSILEQARKVKQVDSLHELIEFYNNEETWAVNIIDRVTTYIVSTITNIFYLYNPEILLLSGSLLENFKELRDLIEEKSNMYLTEPYKSEAKIVFSQLGDTGIVLGAALQASARHFPNFVEQT